MKNPGNTAKLLDLAYAPEADALLDELERSGQFRVGLEAEQEEDNEPAASNDYSWGRVGPGIGHQDLVLARIGDALLVRTADGLDRVVLEGYLGLIPDASTLTIVFNDGSEWSGSVLLARISQVARQNDAPRQD
jgi:hypothetical protein